MLPRLLVVLCVTQSLFIESICEIIDHDVDIQVFTNCFEVSIPEMYEDGTGDKGKYESLYFLGKVIRRNNKTENFSDDTSSLSSLQRTLSLKFPISLNKNDLIVYDYTVVVNGIGRGDRGTHKVKRIFPDHGHCFTENSPTIEFNSIKRYNTDDLIYEEYFDTDCISNRNKWTVEHKFPIEPSSISYQKCACNVDVTKKVLRIKPELAEGTSSGQSYKDIDLTLGCTAVNQIGDLCVYLRSSMSPPPPVIGGRVTSKRAFQFGRFVIVAKVPIGDWLYSDMTLVPHTDGIPSEDDFAGKIMMMIQGNQELRHNGIVIGNKALYTILMNGTRDILHQHNPFIKCLGEEYHTYEIYWSPSEIRFSVDGIIKHAISSTDEALRNMYTKHFDSLFLSISLGVDAGGSLVFPNDVVPKKPWINKNIHTNGKLRKYSKDWYPTWSRNGEMLVKHVKVFAV